MNNEWNEQKRLKKRECVYRTAMRRGRVMVKIERGRRGKGKLGDGKAVGVIYPP